MKNNVIASALAGLIVLGASAAQALPAVYPATYDAGAARPIQGWVDFCRVHPEDCRIDTNEPDVIRLDGATWRVILEVNQRVNAAIRPVTDWEAYGVADLWTYPTNGYGDCEDFQLLKRKLLVEAGIPQRAMRMTVVIDEIDEGHAVLMIRTDRGDFILDNKHDRVLPWQETGYVYVSREGAYGYEWTSLGHVRSPVATARN